MSAARQPPTDDKNEKAHLNLADMDFSRIGLRFYYHKSRSPANVNSPFRPPPIENLACSCCTRNRNRQRRYRKILLASPRQETETSCSVHTAPLSRKQTAFPARSTRSWLRSLENLPRSDLIAMPRDERLWAADSTSTRQVSRCSKSQCRVEHLMRSRCAIRVVGPIDWEKPRKSTAERHDYEMQTGPLNIKALVAQSLLIVCKMCVRRSYTIARYTTKEYFIHKIVVLVRNPMN